MKSTVLTVSFPKALAVRVRRAAKNIGWNVPQYLRWLAKKDLEKRGLK